MNCFSIFFFLPLTFSYYVLSQPSPISFLYSFLQSSPALSRSVLMQSPIAMSVFLVSMPTFWASALCQFFISHFIYMTNLCTPHQLFLRTFLHSNLHSHFIHFLLSALLTPTIITSRSFFANLDLVSSVFMYAGVTHELNTFPLRLRDMRLSPITPSTFLQAFVLAVILTVTKAINLVDFALGKCRFLS